jgi:GDP-4-dehydro-6-deoxy-D-mannose reductase
MDCRLLCVSSSEVYGPVSPERLPIREDMEMHPVNPYAGSKAAVEILALQTFESYGLPIIRVRPFNHTGPRQATSFVCSSLARQVAEIGEGLRPPKVVVGNLEVKRDFSDVRDIVRGYDLLLEMGKPCEVYQLCSGRAVSIQTILQLLVSTVSEPIEIVIDESRIRTHDTPEVRGDYSKAESAVGWKPGHELEATLHDLKLYWQDRLRSNHGEVSRKA